MPGPKQREPLVRTSIVIPQRHFDWLRERAEQDDRSLSYVVREAIDLLQSQSTPTEPTQAAEQVTA